MGDSTVDGKGKKAEKTREVANIRMYHLSRNFFQLGCDMLWWIGDGGWQENCFFFQRHLTILRSCVLVVDNTVDGKENMWRRPWIRWHHYVSLKLESMVFFSSLLASLSSVYSYSNWCVMSWTLMLSHLESVQHLNVPNISTAHHTPPLMKNILTEVIHHDVTNLHGPCHSQCRRPQTHMNLMLSDMLKEWKTLISTNITYSSQHITSLLQPKWYILMLTTSLVFSS